MSPIQRTNDGSHQWTTYEKNTLLALLVKGLHRPGRPGRKDDIVRLTQNAHLNVTTALNVALNGKDGYDNDISKQEVSKMIYKMLREKKAVVGKHGPMERSPARKITRTLRLMWQRETKFDFDGSKEEWAQGRRHTELKKLGITADTGAHKEITTAMNAIPDLSKATAVTANVAYWKRANLPRKASPPPDLSRLQLYRPGKIQTVIPQTSTTQTDGSLHNALCNELTQHGTTASSNSVSGGHKFPIN